jgi:putative ABC transport system ATP-binding protein
MNSAARIEAEGLTRIRGDRTVLDDVSFRVMPGEILSIVGPSGGGKTSLLRLLNRLEEPQRGRVIVDGVPAPDIPVADLRRRLGMVFQRPSLFGGTVADNICYGPRLRGECDVDTADLLTRVGLSESFADRDPEKLSEGEKQRVAIARTLANGPEVLLMDEPTASLDPTATATIEQLTLDLNSRDGLTIVFVTHDLAQAGRLGRRVLLLVEGHKIEEADTHTFLSNPTTDIGRRFIKGELR